MKKFYLFFVLNFFCFGFSQEKANYKLGFFSSVEANFGFDLAAMIKSDRAQTEYEKQQLDPGKFNYGFTAQVGYQPINWFAIGTGLRYSFVDPNFHVIYFTLQPYFFVGNPKDAEFTYLSLNMGRQINQTASRNAGFIGLSIGRFEPINKRFGNKFQINLETQSFDGEGTLFVGFTYGLTFFSNKEL